MEQAGVVVSTEGYDQYKVKIDGSRNVTKRNRKYLRLFQPFIPSDQMPIIAGGGDDSVPKNTGYSSHDVPVLHGENEKVSLPLSTHQTTPVTSRRMTV